MLELIFVYNANSDVKSKVLDYTHKLLSPSTYQCHLCSLTHHNFGKKAEWDHFINTSKLNIRVYYKDQFSLSFPEIKEVELPLIFRKKSNKLELIFDKNQLEKMALGDLIDKLTSLDF